jgi:Bacterial regulatory protein, Fis family
VLLRSPSAETETEPPASDLRGLLEAYERGVILAALAAAGGRQRSAAALLRILPSTLNEKMKRLGIKAQRVHAGGAAVPDGAEDEACLEWRGVVPPGATLELRGLNGPVRVEAGAADRVEVKAVRRGDRRAFSAIEVKIVEHARGVTVCAVCQGLEGTASSRLFRRLCRGVAAVRVDLVARVPPGLHVVASTVNDDVEVVGLSGNVDAGTANGHVRFLPAPPPAAPSATTPFRSPR